MSADFAEWLAARYDEAEALANAADPGPWEVGPNAARKGMVYIREEGDLLDSVGLTWREPVFTSQVPNKTRFRENAAFIAANDPKQRLADIRLKRAILAEHKHEPASTPAHRKGAESFGCVTCDHIPDEGTYGGGWCATVRQLGTEFAECDGYKQEWRPET